MRSLDLGIGERRQASLASAAMGIAGGCRLVRVHDVAGTCKVRDLLAAIAESAEGGGPGRAGEGGASGTTIGAGRPQ